METNNWRKVESEDGYTCYINDVTGKQEPDHPEFMKILQSLKEYDDIKYIIYKIAFKISTLQKYFRVPSLRICSGVFARHQLSLSENSLSLDTAELEAVLGDIYFAAEKEGVFTGDADLTVDLLINLLLNVYDKDRKEPIRVLAAKTLLIILSEEPTTDKWAALANSCADHNGCVSSRRLSALLAYVTALPQYLGCSSDHIQADVDACFDKSAGMLGVSAPTVADWGLQHCASARWLPVMQRILTSRNCASVSASCAACTQPLIQVLKFKCSKCNDTYFCEKCYLYDKGLLSVNGHKKTHLVNEIVDGEAKPAECLGFIRGMKQFFFCTRTKKKKKSKKVSKKGLDRVDNPSNVKKQSEHKPSMVTSTVGKASGNNVNSTTTLLQDIILQLEMQNKAIKDLSVQLHSIAKVPEEDNLKRKVDSHWAQISTQINRLKMLKDNLTYCSANLPPEMQKTDKVDRPPAFDLFSPIPILDKQSKVTDNLKSQPRVLSLDSGNFSVASGKPESQNLLTVSGDALKPVVIHATSDSISTVSMNDISHWYVDQETLNKPSGEVRTVDSSISATEKKYLADVRHVSAGNHKVKELSADLDSVLDRLQQILTNNFSMDDSCFDNTQLRETANEMEGLLGTLIRGVEQRATLNATKGH